MAQAAVGGGRVTAVNSSVQGCCQGQSRGRCRVSRRAERASRAGTVMSWARMVAVVAFAWKTDARAPVARVRLNAMVAQASQAAFAVNLPEGRWARGPLRRSAWTV